MADILKSWLFTSDSNPNKEYETLQYADGTTSCNCKGWTMKKAGKERTCKHTRLVEHGLADSRAQSYVNRAPLQRSPELPTRLSQTEPVYTKVKARKISW